MTKTPPRAMRADALTFSPRFEYGDQAQVAVVCGPQDGSKLGAGYVRLFKAEIPWTIKYDEVILVLEGNLTVRTTAGDRTAGPNDAIWLPAGTQLTYVAENALVFYAIHPADWADES